MMDRLQSLSWYPKLTLKKYQAIARAWNDISFVWECEFNELAHVWRDEKSAHDFLEWRDNFDINKAEQLLDAQQISIVTIAHEGYPDLLKKISDPPYALFVRGILHPDIPRLAVVGTRNMTHYGKHITEELIAPLTEYHIEIVSGLARGIDSVAHMTTLKHGGVTSAVLGAGVDDASIYPRAHYRLVHDIIESGGAVISEYPPGTEPNTYTFPKRNRIIAGMSLATMVIEADEKSGALITSTCALEYGRDVYAVPHALTSPTGRGPNKLIKDGAYLVRNADDIIAGLNITEFERQVQVRKYIPENPHEASILTILSLEPLHIDAITRKSNLPAPQVIAILTILEMRGRVKNMGNMTYIART